MQRHELVLIPVESVEENPLGIGGEKPTEPTNKQKGKVKGQDVLEGVLIYDVAKKISVGAVSRIGSATGNYVLQNQINNIQTLGMYALAIAKGGGVGLAYVMLDVGGKVFDYNMMMNKATLETQYYRQAVGMSSSNGGRTGGRKI